MQGLKIKKKREKHNKSPIKNNKYELRVITLRLSLYMYFNILKDFNNYIQVICIYMYKIMIITNRQLNENTQIIII